MALVELPGIRLPAPSASDVEGGLEGRDVIGREEASVTLLVAESDAFRLDPGIVAGDVNGKGLHLNPELAGRLLKVQKGDLLAILVDVRHLSLLGKLVSGFPDLLIIYYTY